MRSHTVKRLRIALTVLLILGTGRLLLPAGSEAAAAEEPYELVMQFVCDGEEPEGLSDVQDAINEIIEERIGVKLSLLPGSNPSFDASMTIASGEKLDLCVSLYGSMSDLIGQGYLLSLDDLLDSRESGKAIRQVCGVQLEGGRYQGKIYGIPTVYSEGQRYGFICSTSLMEKYGFTVEEGKYYTFDEMEAFFDRVKEGEGDSFYILGGAMSRTHLIDRSEYAYDILGASVDSGVMMLEEETVTEKIVNFYSTEEFQEFAERMYRWQKKGFFAPDSAISEEDSNYLMKEGKILGWFFHNVPGEEVENASKSGMDVTFIPTKEAVRTTDVCQDVLWSIPITCENPEKVMDFLELLYTDEEVLNLLQRGIENVSYVVKEETEDGKQIALPEGETVDSIPYYTNLGMFGNRLLAYTWEPGEADRNRQIREFSDGISRTSPAWGYVFDREPVALEFSQVEDVVNKYYGVIVTGSVDPAIELVMFQKELEEAGIEAVIEENQSQYDSWKSGED